MVRTSLATLAVSLLVFLSGCLVDTSTSSLTGPPDSPTTILPEDGHVLGLLYLHHDGTRLWMDDQPGDSVALPGAAAGGQGATYRFPLEPSPSQDVITAGTALITLGTSGTASVSGSSPVFRATVYIDGVAVGSASGRGSAAHSLAVAIPALIPAGSAVALEVCSCGSVTDLSASLFEPGQSQVDVPGPTQAACGSSALVPGVASVRPQGNQWVATRTDTGSGAAPASYQSLTLVSHNGDLDLVREGSNQYGLQAELHAGGATRQEAQSRLDAMCIDVEAGAGTLAARLVATDGLPQPWNNRGADVHLKVPGAAVDQADLDTSNGAVRVEGLDVRDLVIDSSNGQVTVHADVQDLLIDTSNDGIELRGAFGSLQADTSNAPITLDARPLGTGAMAWLLDTSNDAIRATVATGADIGYDATGSTSNDEVTFDLPDAQPVGTQRETQKHVRTNGFDSRAQRVTLTMDSSNDGIELST